MNDKYKYKQAEITSAISNLKIIVEDYSTKIAELNNAIMTIQSSTLWKDEQIKTSFIETCNSYLIIFKNLIIQMNRYIKYIEKKSDGATQLESAFSR